MPLWNVAVLLAGVEVGEVTDIACDTQEEAVQIAIEQVAWNFSGQATRRDEEHEDTPWLCTECGEYIPEGEQGYKGLDILCSVCYSDLQEDVDGTE